MPCAQRNGAASGMTAEEPVPEIIRMHRLCSEALLAVTGDRRNAYGHPKEFFTKFAAACNGLFQINLTAQDYNFMLCLFKILREKNNPKWDNRVDQIGYVLTQEMLLS